MRDADAEIVIDAMTDQEVGDLIRAAWADVPTPAPDQIHAIAWASGDAAWHAFAGVHPNDVDTGSVGFLGCTPLWDLPPAAAAAYVAPYLESLLESVSRQAEVGLFHDVLTRAHVLHCLCTESFWQWTVRPHLSLACRRALYEFVRYLATRHEAVALSLDEILRILGFAEAAISE